MVRKATGAGGLTVSALAKRFGLSRSTLLHYHRIQLCRPTGRSAAGYRVYGPEAVARLTRIVELRSAGLPLQTIRRVLDAQTPLAEALHEQVAGLNQQMARLRAQQQVVLSLLELTSRKPSRQVLSKESWTRMFQAIGLSDEDMHRWHQTFEQDMPEAHAEFLRSLGLSAAEVRQIREASAR